MHRPWWAKATVQGAVALVPGSAGTALNRVLQRLASGSLDLDEGRFASRFASAGHHLGAWRTRSSRAVPASVGEIGTGSFPIVPVALAVAGVESIVTIDIDSMVTERELDQVLAFVAAAVENGQALEVLGTLDEDRVGALRELRGRPVGFVLGTLGIERRIGRLEDVTDEFELVLSNHTLEHIPEPVLVPLLRGIRRVLAAGGVTDHYINMSDHYASFDDRISQYNFLRFGDRSWRLINNRFQFQNRLRARDYIEAFRAAGLEFTTVDLELGDEERLSTLKLANRYRQAEFRELAPVGGWFTAVADSDRASSTNQPSHRNSPSPPIIPPGRVDSAPNSAD